LIDYRLSIQPSVGAIIVDPATKEVVAVGHGDPDHPTRHAVMVCIDNVTKRQGGGAWNSDSERKGQGSCSCLSVYFVVITTCNFYDRRFSWVLLDYFI
jgi:tRNA(Arg) A34 adenosine deaminase TadA